MSKTRPVHQWETLDETDDAAGRSWVVRPEHAGHTMTVVGRIVSDGSASSMFVVACSCGDEYRMAEPTIAKHIED